MALLHILSAVRSRRGKRQCASPPLLLGESFNSIDPWFSLCLPVEDERRKPRNTLGKPLTRGLVSLRQSSVAESVVFSWTVSIRKFCCVLVAFFPAMRMLAVCDCCCCCCTVESPRNSEMKRFATRRFVSVMGLLFRDPRGGAGNSSGPPIVLQS